jgi:hypothetical protein
MQKRRCGSDLLREFREERELSPMTGKRFTKDETLLCTYAARYDAEDFGRCGIIKAFARISTGRPESSIPAKIVTGQVSTFSRLDRTSLQNRLV